MNLQTSTMNLKLRWTACQSTLKSARIPPFLVSGYIPFLQHLRCDSSSSSSSLDSVQQTPVQRQATPVVLCFAILARIQGHPVSILLTLPDAHKRTLNFNYKSAVTLKRFGTEGSTASRQCHCYCKTFWMRSWSLGPYCCIQS